MSVFLKFSGKSKAFSLDSTLQNQLNNYFNELKINLEDVFFAYQGKCISSFDRIQKDSTIHVAISLKGGKGGFGAKLKNQGGKKIRPNDNMFSRDAHGRRIEYQNMQRDYTQFVKKKMEEDKKVTQEWEQFKVMQDTMKQGQSFMKMDKQYNSELERTQSKLSESIRIGKIRFMEKIKKQQEQRENQEKKQTDPDKITKEQEKSEHNFQNKQQKNQKQLKEDAEIQSLGQPTKKVKKQTENQSEKIQKPIQKPLVGSQLLSAKDKLKSLFKK